MLIYLAKRILLMLPLLIGITIITFLVVRLAPGEPVDLASDLNPKMTAEAKERLRAHYGLDKPLYEQYLSWITKIATLDFGTSFSPDGRKVIDKISERLPITIKINLLSMGIILLVSIPLGVFASYKKDSFFDKSTTLFSFAGFAMPHFWLALLLMILFGIKLGWLPLSGYKSLNYNSLSFLGQYLDVAKHLVIPIIVFTTGGIAGMSRYVRSKMLEVIRQDYITTARAKGLENRKVLFKHALRNALLPVITILGLSVPGLIGGSVIMESIFAIPGMGLLFYQSVLARDYPVIMGILVIGAFLTLLGNLLADIGYSVADPRIRVGEKGV